MVCQSCTRHGSERSRLLRSLAIKYIQELRFEYEGIGPVGVDCYGLIRVAFHEALGIVLPLFDYPKGADEGAKETFAVGFDAFDGLFERIDPPPLPFDVIFAPRKKRDHLYLVVDETYAIHAADVVGVVRISWLNLLYLERNAEILRYIGPRPS